MKQIFTLKKILVILIITVCIGTLLYSIKNIGLWYIDNKETQKQIEEIHKTTKTISVPSTEITEEEIPETPNEYEEEPETKANIEYWNYVNMDAIYVDFEELKAINNDVKGWLQLNNTKINYPFVQTKDNKYYLTHSFNKSFNQAGWVFLDYRNNINNLDQNTIIYAHGRLDGTMFSDLKYIFKNNWFKNTSNHIIKVITEKETTIWQVFSLYKIKNTSDYLQINFINNNEYLTFLNMLKNRSEYNFNTTINENDKIITLSTCYTKTIKSVIHAKLIKTEPK